MIKLGTNIASLTAQRRLQEATSGLAKVYERLSSGMRINTASDDAAGLSISDGLNAESRILGQGVRNLNDGISLLNIAESAIGDLSDIVSRLNELAEQAANGSYSAVQRKAIDAEAQSLSAEYFRIASSTSYNGKKLFTGENPIINLQAGAGAYSTLSFGTGGDMGTGTFGAAKTLLSAIVDAATADFNGDGILDVVAATPGGTRIMYGDGNGGFGTVSGTFGGFPSEYQVGDFNNDGHMDIGGIVGAELRVFLNNGDGTFKSTITTSTFAGSTDLKLGDLNGDGRLDAVVAFGTSTAVFLGTGSGTFSFHTSFTEPASTSISLSDLNGDGVLDLVGVGTGSVIRFGNGSGGFGGATTLNGVDTLTSVTTADLNGDGVMDIVAGNDTSNSLNVFFGRGSGSFSPAMTIAVGPDARDIVTGDINGDGRLDILSANYTGGGVYVMLNNGDGTFSAGVSIATSQLSTLELADFNNDGVLDVLAGQATMAVYLGLTKDGIGPLLPFSLKTQAGAKQSLSIFKNKLEDLIAQRGEIGSHLSRISVATNVLTTTRENLIAAESRIRDADIAEETSKLIRLQIQQRAASAVLAQANQQPSLALKLLNNI